MRNIKSILTGCMSVLEFHDVIEIDAPAEIVFSVITDYKHYDELLPMLHDKLEIVSDETEGLGVSWKSTGTFKGHEFITVWTVTEYDENRKVVLKDLEGDTGTSILETSPVNEIQALYSMYIRTKMFKPYEEDFIAIYRKEMMIVKEESEILFRESASNGK